MTAAAMIAPSSTRSRFGCAARGGSAPAGTRVSDMGARLVLCGNGYDRVEGDYDQAQPEADPGEHLRLLRGSHRSGVVALVELTVHLGGKDDRRDPQGPAAEDCDQ